MDLRASPLFMIGLVCNIQCWHQHHIKDEFSQMHLWNGITAFKYRAYGRDSLARSFRNPGIAKRGPGSDPCHGSSFIISSVRSSYSHHDLLLITSSTHFFRSHRSSTLDFHFLSHYSYMEATILYKGKTWQDSGIIWNTLAYSGILWHTLAYSGIL